MSAPEEHALLCASGSKKWLNCTPSARLEEQLPDRESEYAKEGRLAHAIGELKLRKHFTPMGPKKYADEMRKLQADPLYNSEMQGYTDDYLDYVQQVVHSFPSTPYVVIEKKLDFSHIAPEGFGTGDCLILGGNILNVVDLKYGEGVPVSAENNSQMMLYALGALRAYSLLYAINTVRMAIVQPRLGSPSEWSITAQDLRAWGESIKPRAQLAFAGEGEFCAGSWCDDCFCRAGALCRARANTMTALEAFGGNLPPLISDAEVGEILTQAQTLKAWVSDLEEYALSALLQGVEIPGWKAVEGRSNRKFTNVDVAFKVLTEAGYDEAILYERKPITLTAVETLLKKKQFNEMLGSYVIKPPGKPTLATETDNREALRLTPTAEEAFKEAV